MRHEYIVKRSGLAREKTYVEGFAGKPALWACVQSQMPFDSTKLFSDIHLEKA